MPISFRDLDKQYWEKWLPPDLGERLDTIRKLVEHLYRSVERFPQLKWYMPHGVGHCEAVETILHRLIPMDRHEKLTEDEKFFLLASAWLHDIGMLRGVLSGDENCSDAEIRESHHIRSQRYILNNYRQIGVLETEATAFSLLARYHRRRCSLSTCRELLPIEQRGDIRLRLLAAYLRLADALHIDQSRAPAEQYAISLTYDIPRKSKLHWLRSKFVLGIDIDTEEQEIAVHLKSPTTRYFSDDLTDRSLERTLDSIHDLIVQDLIDELNTVKDVLFAAGITYFLKVPKIKHAVEFDDQLQRDIKSVLNYYFLMDNPSSSALLQLLFESILGILSVTPQGGQENSGTSAIDAVQSFINEIEYRILGSRKCHTGLRNFVKEIREKIGFLDIAGLRDWVKGKKQALKCKRRCLRYNSFRYFRKEHLHDKRPSKFPVFNILLYGYSELVIKSLCGFRDAILSELVKQYVTEVESTANASGVLEEICDEYFRNSEQPLPRLAKFALFHKADLEKEASKYFRIFICEGQPKNRTGWGGRSIYHDGLQYSITLSEHGFREIYIIADAIAATLICPRFPFDGTPNIDFIMVGANGFDDKKFLHSAGHTMVVALSDYAKRMSSSETFSPNKKAPTLVLALITDKYEKSNELSGKDSESCESGQRQQGDRGNIFTLQDGWKFRDPFGHEPVRNHAFFTQDTRMRETLEREASSVAFYNPREDRIAIECVDVVITEKGWMIKDKIEQDQEWNGEYIRNMESP